MQEWIFASTSCWEKQSSQEANGERPASETRTNQQSETLGSKNPLGQNSNRHLQGLGKFAGLLAEVRKGFPLFCQSYGRRARLGFLRLWDRQFGKRRKRPLHNTRSLRALDWHNFVDREFIMMLGNGETIEMHTHRFI